MVDFAKNCSIMTDFQLISGDFSEKRLNFAVISWANGREFSGKLARDLASFHEILGENA